MEQPMTPEQIRQARRRNGFDLDAGPTDTEAMDAIAAVLGEEEQWSSDEIEGVADIVVATGRTEWCEQ
jgi:hypothetical protein